MHGTSRSASFWLRSRIAVNYNASFNSVGKPIISLNSAFESNTYEWYFGLLNKSIIITKLDYSLYKSHSPIQLLDNIYPEQPISSSNQKWFVIRV